MKKEKTLRRLSFRILSVVVTAIFLAVSAGAAISLQTGINYDAFGVMALCLGVVGMSRRILGSRVVLDRSTLTVINPVFTYIIPRSLVGGVNVASNGTLSIITRSGREIEATGFGGSLVDHFVGSTEKAVSEINVHLNSRPRAGSDSSAGESRHLSRAWVADACTVSALACGLVAVVLGNGW
ncbi:hypothetical protein OG413_01680 [Streptomyces sp. NBC_01433]|uniref:hypothetical protein n=1 Tax=Streptomyces sp. NBC_01433 TaxID=2903864 RepID=UPI0022545E9A|nr:hypothetical protein [Streptomyces sp. NBC_01433]MCX4674041.1 hypothetical protein [Streptomyces sp. NBC_01433]